MKLFFWERHSESAIGQNHGNCGLTQSPIFLDLVVINPAESTSFSIRLSNEVRLTGAGAASADWNETELRGGGTGIKIFSFTAEPFVVEPLDTRAEARQVGRHGDLGLSLSKPLGLNDLLPICRHDFA